MNYTKNAKMTQYSGTHPTVKHPLLRHYLEAFHIQQEITLRERQESLFLQLWAIKSLKLKTRVAYIKYV